MKRTGLLLLTLLLTGITPCLAKDKKFEVIAYYTGDGTTIQNYPIDKLTHIIFSFLHLRGDTISFDNEKQAITLRQLTDLKKKYPKLKILVSLGGWGGCETCSPVFAQQSGRKNFAASVVRLLKTYNADGIDLDWEYPSIEGYPHHAYISDDRQNFSELIKECRKAMGSKYELSFAAGGFETFLSKSVDWQTVMPLVTRVNLMTYDLVNGNSKQTGHHTALYSRPEQLESTDNCVKYLLKTGLPANKLVIGAAFYARIWEQVNSTANGLYQQGTFKRSLGYKQFDTVLNSANGWVHYWDDTAKAPYAYNSGQQLFATFDNAQSLAAKVTYAHQHGLKGIMFWELMNDTFSNGRLDAIDKAVK
jgi:chitinase